MPNRRTLKEKLAASAKRIQSPSTQTIENNNYLASDLTRTVGVTILALILQLAMKFYLHRQFGF